jgi:hypothetical protein
MDNLNFFDIVMGTLYSLGGLLSGGVVLGIVLHFVRKKNKDNKKDFVVLEPIRTEFTGGDIELLFETFISKKVKLELTNFDGDTLLVLAEGTYEEGIHQVKLNTLDFDNGTYFYKLTTDNQNINKKIKIKNNSI